jgi:prolyl-tRNA editing enzyme YbaK/EbsC (Cys-tRNA(Pro) deacylase)
VGSRGPTRDQNPGDALNASHAGSGGARRPHRFHVHASKPRSLSQAARERGPAPKHLVRSLLFRLEDGQFVLVLAAGPARVSWPRLRRHLGVSRIATATPSEVLEATGYEPGAVSPFGLRPPLRLLAGQRLQAHKTLSIGAGIRSAGVVLARGIWSERFPSSAVTSRIPGRTRGGGPTDDRAAERSG